MWMVLILLVALRKESVDRNTIISYTIDNERKVALRKESVDRNLGNNPKINIGYVALRKESVDRNKTRYMGSVGRNLSLSARRAWIEIFDCCRPFWQEKSRSPQGERG